MAEYNVLEDVNASDYLDRSARVEVDISLIGQYCSYEVSMMLNFEDNLPNVLFFDTKEDFKKFVENLQTIVSEIEDAHI